MICSLDLGTNYSKESQTDIFQVATDYHGYQISGLTEPGHLVWSWKLEKALPLENEEPLISTSFLPGIMEGASSIIQLKLLFIMQNNTWKKE